MGEQTETPAQTIARLTAALEEANKTIANFQAEKKQLAEDEKVIREKMSHGLSREQAMAVIKRQKEHDAMEAEAKAKLAKAPAK